MANTWLIVANASQATVYETESHPKTLKLLKEFLHPASRAKGVDLASDRPGHFQGEARSMEGATHGSTPRTMSRSALPLNWPRSWMQDVLQTAIKT